MRYFLNNWTPNHCVNRYKVVVCLDTAEKRKRRFLDMLCSYIELGYYVVKFSLRDRKLENMKTI